MCLTGDELINDLHGSSCSCVVVFRLLSVKPQILDGHVRTCTVPENVFLLQHKSDPLQPLAPYTPAQSQFSKTPSVRPQGECELLAQPTSLPQAAQLGQSCFLLFPRLVYAGSHLSGFSHTFPSPWTPTPLPRLDSFDSLLLLPDPPTKDLFLHESSLPTLAGLILPSCGSHGPVCHHCPWRTSSSFTRLLVPRAKCRIFIQLKWKQGETYPKIRKDW